MMDKLEWREGRDGGDEAYATHDLWVVWWGSPGEPSSPPALSLVRAGGFVGRASALDDCSLYDSEAAARAAMGAWRDKRAAEHAAAMAAREARRAAAMSADYEAWRAREAGHA